MNSPIRIGGLIAAELAHLMPPKRQPGQPTVRQLAYLRRLSHKCRCTFVVPSTTDEASREIEKLLRKSAA